MDIDLTPENLSEAFGFAVSVEFVEMLKGLHECSPEEPHKGLAEFGLELGGPLYGFSGGGSGQSLRCPQMPPEFFPFAVRRSEPDIYVGFLVDDPRVEGEPNTCFAVFVQENASRCGVIANSESELSSWLELYRNDLDGLGVSRSGGTYDADEVKKPREGSIVYQTADRLGVVVPQENAPLTLLHEEFRCRLIEKRDRQAVREAGLTALRVEAPGAALALARDITWWLGHRQMWYQLANELYVGAYSLLRRPLLARIVRREWVRLYGRKG